MDKTDRIAFVNMQEILKNCNAGKKAIEDIKKHYEKDALEIKSVEEDLKKMKEELEKKSSLSETDRMEKETAYQKKFRDYQLRVSDANEELKKRDQVMTQQLVPGILKTIDSIAEKEKYVIVVDVSVVAFPYYAKENDISGRVIEELNKAE